ncbi:PEP-CTERM sorting domain-containing protein [Novosphingobium colocasiae]|uniref:PEP-CTERM sorting domain-containing protein n=1 Tax=Novosphingobium colocasiae TaxID=1256513 RepID=UPI0035B186A5
MIRKSMIAAALIAGTSLMSATPALAGTKWWTHTHYCNCGDKTGSSMCGTTTTSGGTTTTSGGTTTTSGGTTTTSGGTTTTSGGTTTTSSGGTAVPEPGMLGMMGMGLLGLAYARRRKTRA